MAIDAAIIGAGSMGTALAQFISQNVREVFLFARRTEVVESINRERANKDYFPALRLRKNIRAFSMGELGNINEVQALILAVPSSSIREVADTLKEYPRDRIIISVAKGIEYPSLKTMSQVIAEETGNENVIAFSGATFADEIAYGRVAGVTLGIRNETPKPLLTRMFDGFGLDYSRDIETVELCGVLKNVYAIALGMWDSVMGGHNGHYAFLTLCFKEMNDILRVISSDEEIATKFCCFGDLNLTCNVDKSRNRTLGLMLGKKLVLPGGVRASVVLEGVKSAKAIKEVASRHAVHAPIAGFVSEVLEGRTEIDEEIYRVFKVATMKGR
ncbi:MAG: NAD(P)H-dependent glycerol-3-phosphate dehydrogenase [Thermoplasmata archaeon]